VARRDKMASQRICLETIKPHSELQALHVKWEVLKREIWARDAINFVSCENEAFKWMRKMITRALEKEGRERRLK